MRMVCVFLVEGGVNLIFFFLVGESACKSLASSSPARAYLNAELVLFSITLRVIDSGV